MTDPLSRIVIINDRSVARGGATMLALQLAHGLAERGHPVTFFSGDDPSPIAAASPEIDWRGVGGKALLNAPLAGAVAGIFNRQTQTLFDRLIDSIDDAGVVYHVHGWSQILSPSIFSALRRVADRVLVTAHDFFLACPNGNYMNFPANSVCALKPLSASCIATDCDKRNYAHKVWRLARQASLRATTAYPQFPFTVAAIQEGMVPRLVLGGIPEDKIRVLTNPAARLSAARCKAENNRLIAYVGRIEHEKGVDFLAAACARADAPLHLIGEGSLEAAVRAANPKAIFHGWRTQRELADILKSARVLVMPSRAVEPFGLAGAEAAAMGIPVIASQFCLIGPSLERNGMGEIVDILDAAAFAARISALLSDDARIERMSRAGFENAHLIGSDPEAWIASHLAVYRQLVSAAPVTTVEYAPA